MCEPESSGNISDISGVRSNGRVTVTTRDGRDYSEDGEVQFTDYGLSGIVVFDLSYYDDIKTITIDTLFDISEDEFVSLFVVLSVKPLLDVSCFELDNKFSAMYPFVPFIFT